MNLNPEQQRERLLELQKSLTSVDEIHVLIVDDDQGDAEMAQSKLQQYGIQSEIALNGIMAVDSIERNGFMLVFLDWKLIGRSGLETLKAIKAKSQKCVVVILTGIATDSDAAVALEHGAALVIAKPLTDESIKLIFGRPTL